MPYRFREDVATADVAFEASGKTLEEVFTAAADALLNVMVEHPEAVEPREEREIHLENNELDLLLFEFLQAFIYLKDVETLMLRARDVKVTENGGHLHELHAMASGEKLDPERHHPLVDVKAVTLHRFRLSTTPEGWEAF